jgi:hypothetical protein
MWTMYPLGQPSDTDEFEDREEAINAATRLADASGRDYRVTNGSQSFTIEPEEED